MLSSQEKENAVNTEHTLLRLGPKWSVMQLRMVLQKLPSFQQGIGERSEQKHNS